MEGEDEEDVSEHTATFFLFHKSLVSQENDPGRGMS
jgi:hypothetical protein